MKKIISLFSLLVLSSSSFFLLLFSNKNKSQNQKQIINKITKAHPSGKIYLEVEEENFSLNQPFKVLVFADSGNDPITGFDLVLNYNPQKLSFKNLNSLIPEYQIFKKVEQNEIRITAIKPPEIKTLTILKNTPLMEIFFIPQEKGEVEISLNFSLGAKNESNLINNQSEDILSEAKGIKINIQ